jgi:hypothetical protein
VSDHYSDGTQNHLYRRQCKDTDPPSYFEVRQATSAIDVQLDRLEEIDDTDNVVSCSDSDEESQDSGNCAYEWIACTHNTCKVEDQGGQPLCFSVKVQDPSIEDIGDPSNLNNFLIVVLPST